MTDEDRKLSRRIPLTDQQWQLALNQLLRQNVSLKEIAEWTNNTVEFLQSKLNDNPATKFPQQYFK